MTSKLQMHRATLLLTMARCALWIGLLAAAAEPSFAASGGQMTLPTAPLPGQKPPKPSGLVLSIDTSWVASNGYRPVRIKITPIAPVTADRTLMIRLSPVETSRYYFQRGADLGVTQQFDIPAQSRGVSGTIAVPQYSPWARLKVDVFEDGEPVEELSREDVYVNSEGTINGSFSINGASNAVNIGRAPAVLQIGGSGTDTNGHVWSLFQNGFSPWSWLCVENNEVGSLPAYPEAQIWQLATQSRLSSAADLPQRWIDYSGVDVFETPLPKLQRLIEKQPRQWAAIRLAVAAGANLWVYDVGDRYARLSELEKALDLPPQPKADGGAPDAAGWDAPDPSQQNSEEGSRAAPANDAVLTKKHSSTKIDRRAKPFLIHALGCGQVAAIDTSRPNANQLNWNSVLNTAGTRRLSWTARHGMVLAPEELMDNKPDFWQFLIPGVGLTPVVQFQILISLFVIGIGPVNYLLLRRWRRLGLLLITVPASAAIVTLVLFCYALIHDGLGVRVRARSFTQLDLRRGEAVCWTRLSYYAGLSPSQGLTFPGDVAVYPFGQEPPPYRGGERRPKEIDWQEAEPSGKSVAMNQHFSTDWLPSRTPTQFITVRSRKTTAALGITQPVPGSAPKLENHLGTRIRSLVLTDAAGKYFGASELESEASATLAPLAADQALKAIQKTLSENDLQLPGGAQMNWFQPSNNYYPRPGYYAPTTSPPPDGSFQIANSGPAPQHDSILERSLHDWTQSLEPRSFVAIVEKSPEVVLGLDSAREEASLHVVVGQW
jgi:hypothetical protein